MNIYTVTGMVRYTRITECACCGQETEKECESKHSVQVKADDEEAAQAAALIQIEQELRANYKNDDIAGLEWGKKDTNRRTKPKVEFVREITEAERLREIGAPQLF